MVDAVVFGARAVAQNPAALPALRLAVLKANDAPDGSDHLALMAAEMARAGFTVAYRPQRPTHATAEDGAA